MKVLLTNDDGFEAEGMQRFHDVLSKRFECFIVAPDQGRSCCGHAVTTSSALDVVQQRERAWTVSGTPADCIRIGLLWLKLKPDLVISGVNQGGNLGLDIIQSGTVAAAREAYILGIPSIAISQYMRRDVARDWSMTGRRALFVLESLLDRKDSQLGFWNVNLPALLPTMREMSFPITECAPENQPLAFEFEMEEREIDVVDSGLSSDDTKRNPRVIYKSNYQLRPRAEGSDVDLCFAGHATLSRLRLGDFSADLPIH